MIDLKSWIKILAAHPFLFILFPILFLYSNNIHLLTFEGVILPTIGLLSFGFILWIILRFVLKSSRKSAILVSLYAVLFFSYGHIFHLLSENAIESFEIRHENNAFEEPLFALVPGVGISGLNNCPTILKNFYKKQKKKIISFIKK